ncbi:phosphate acyltransferase PlsX [soil metagenome]
MTGTNSGNIKIRVVVDAMGGDFGPVNEVAGSILAVKEKPEHIEIILTGKEDLLKKELSRNSYSGESIKIVNADEVITMEDSPTEAFKSKPNSSLNVGLDLLKKNEADAFISAGNTGAVLAASTLKLGRIKGVSRPTIGSIFPTDTGRKTMVFDVGASVDCRPQHLLEYAIMGSIYMNYIFKVDKPKIGLLNVGEEKSKGNELTIQTYELLERSGLNFIGNIEGRDVLKAKADVVVCDGFVGNVILKFAESVLDVLRTKFKMYADQSLFKKIMVGLSYKTLKAVIKDFDYQEYGGVPLLGVNGVSIIGHGKSSPLAIKNMIFKGEEVVRSGVNAKIASDISEISQKVKAI